MNLQIRIVLISFALLFQNVLTGQGIKGFTGPDCPNEKIEILVSQESAFAGEILWFKVYCTSPLFPGKDLSHLAFVELVSSDNTSLIRKKILLRNGEGSGEFEIPDNLNTGLYYILAYTNWMKNFGELSFFRKAIAIINPEQPLNNHFVSQDPEIHRKDASVTGNDGALLKLIPDKNKYSAREKVTMKIKTNNISGKVIRGNISVTVYLKEPQMIFNTGKSTGEDLVKDPGKIVFLPDYKGIMLTGKLTALSGDPLPGVFVTESTPGPGTDIKSSITDNDGYFHFLLKPVEGDQDVLITAPDADVRISLEESFWNGFRNPPDNLSLVLDYDAVSFLKEKYTFYQLQKRFKRQYMLKETGLKTGADSSLFYTMPYQFIEFGNYIDLDSLREYFYELVPSVKFTQKRGEIDISVIDPRTISPLENKPGVFLDGIPYDNYAGLANIPVGDLDRMAVIPNTYYYKDFTFGGILDIHTKKSDFTSVSPLPNMTRFIYPVANRNEWRFVPPDYSVADSLNRVPDLRYLLLWEPDIRIDNPGEPAIHFYTGDVYGSFIVKVVGITDEGELLMVESEIVIKD